MHDSHRANDRHHGSHITPPCCSDHSTTPVDWPSLGLREDPFAPEPDPRFLFLSRAHEVNLSEVLYGIGAGRGVAVITGGAGLGKTILCRALLDQVEGAARKVLLDAADLRGRDIASAILNPDDAHPHASRNTAPAGPIAPIANDAAPHHRNERAGKPRRKNARKRAAQRAAQRSAGAPPPPTAAPPAGKTIIVIDNAHLLDEAQLSLLDALLATEERRGGAIHLILSGHPELKGKIDALGRSPLKRRLSGCTILRPLLRPEAREYIAHRLRTAALRDGPHRLSRAAVETIVLLSHGRPRTLNRLCAMALAGKNPHKTPRRTPAPLAPASAGDNQVLNVATP